MKSTNYKRIKRHVDVIKIKNFWLSQDTIRKYSIPEYGWYAAKTVLMGEFMVLSVYIREEERSQINNPRT